MRKEFATHRLNSDGFGKAEIIAFAFDTLLEKLEQLLVDGGDGRCMAIARTKLEEACFFVKKAIASHPGNQDGDTK